MNVKEPRARNRRNIRSLSDCNGIRTHKHLVRKRTLHHLAKQAKWLMIDMCFEYLSVWCIWLYVIIMSRYHVCYYHYQIVESSLKWFKFLSKCLSVRSRIKCLWVQIPLQSFKWYISHRLIFVTKPKRGDNLSALLVELKTTFSQFLMHKFQHSNFTH